MKTRFSVLSIVVAVILTSCSENEVFLLMPEENSDNAQLRSLPISHSPWFNWEETVDIVFRGEHQVLPWYSRAETGLLGHVRNDFRQRDGWVMVYNTISPQAGESNGRNHYLIFYNKFTGVLRHFYFHGGNPVGQNTATFWRFHFDGQSSLLNNAQGYFTEPMNSTRRISEITTSNISEGKALSHGWSAFDVQLAFDEDLPNTRLIMNVSPQGILEQNLQFFGIMRTIGERVVKTTATSSTTNPSPAPAPPPTPAVDGVGHAARAYINDARVSGAVKGMSQDARNRLGNVVATSAFNSGVHLAFGSFTSRRESVVSPFSTTFTETEEVTRFTSSDTISMTGTLSSLVSSEVRPMSGLHVPGSRDSSTNSFVPSYNEPLGVWNIRSQPVVRISDATRWVPYEIVFEDDPGPEEPILGIPSYYNALVRPVREFHLVGSSVQVVINPAIRASIERHEVAIELVHYTRFQGDRNWGNQFANLLAQPNDQLLSFFSGIALMSNTDTEIIRDPCLIGSTRMMIPKCVHGRPCHPGVLRHTPSPFSTNFVVKVTVTLFPKASLGYNPSPVIMTRSFLPRYERIYEFQSLKPLYPWS